MTSLCYSVIFYCATRVDTLFWLFIQHFNLDREHFNLSCMWTLMMKTKTAWTTIEPVTILHLEGENIMTLKIFNLGNVILIYAHNRYIF